MKILVPQSSVLSTRTYLNFLTLVYLFDVFKQSLQIERLPEEIEGKLRTHKIIPDLLDDSPNETIAIKYMGGFSLDLGEEIIPRDVKEKPFHIRFDAEDGHYYSLLFTDLDAPSRQNPTQREFLHWLKVNLNGSDVRDCKIKGEPLADYVPPNPANGTGFHRFIYQAFKHPQGKPLAFDEPFLHTVVDDPRRQHFSSKKFARKYNLGKPIAINFFVAEFKPYYDENPTMGPDTGPQDKQFYGKTWQPE